MSSPQQSTALEASVRQALSAVVDPNTGKDIISSLALGQEAIGVPQIAGNNPFAPRIDVLDRPDKSDPHNQNIVVATTAYFTALRLNPNYYVRHMTKTGNTL